MSLFRLSGRAVDDLLEEACLGEAMRKVGVEDGTRLLRKPFITNRFGIFKGIESIQQGSSNEADLRSLRTRASRNNHLRTRIIVHRGGSDI